MENVDQQTVSGFGDEWTRFDQRGLSTEEHEKIFGQYFELFPWDAVGRDAVGFDAGCGSGRWARLVAPRVGKLHCVDASEEALAVAKRNLADAPNVAFSHTSIAEMPFADGSMDFGYSLGVLHHMPDTPAAVRACVRKLKIGAPFLLYLYYAFDNRPAWFRSLWKASDSVRRVVSNMPHSMRYAASQALAVSVYWPLARSAKALEALGARVDNLPLSAYRDRSLYVMRTDALDRFGTRLEQRFTREEIRGMLEAAGVGDVRFSSQVFWCAVGRRVS